MPMKTSSSLLFISRVPFNLESEIRHRMEIYGNLCLEIFSVYVLRYRLPRFNGGKCQKINMLVFNDVTKRSIKLQNGSDFRSIQKLAQHLLYHKKQHSDLNLLLFFYMKCANVVFSVKLRQG